MIYTFKELEKSHERLPVHVTGKEAISGFFTLDGAETRAVLRSKKPLNFHADERGWFDLQLSASGGRSLLLHNALFVGSTQYGMGSSADYETHILPNVVLFSYSPANGNVRSISFTLSGLRYFFFYGYVEEYFIYRPSGDLVNALKTIREASNNEDRRRPHDFFRPRKVYIVHDIRRIMKFQIGSRYYSIGVSAKFGGGPFGNIQFDTEPVATIAFNEPTSLDDAIEAISEWQQFFVQIAMQSMHFEAIASKKDKKHAFDNDNLYLTYLKKTTNKERDWHIHPGQIPFNTWSQRSIMRGLMINWLEIGNKRQKFRRVLGRVIEQLGEKADLDCLMRLCGCIESLPELSESGSVTKVEIDLMANAASSAINETRIRIELSRIQGTLSLLARPSLSRRLDMLSKLIESVVPLEISNPLIKAVPNLRNLIAHGGSVTDGKIPMVAPVVEGLAAMCAIFDLVGSGMSKQDDERVQMKAIEFVLRSWKELEALNN